MIDGLGGLALGLLAEGRLAPEEVDHLLSWMLRHADRCDEWPVNALFARASRLLGEGLTDAAGRRELFGLLAALCPGSVPPPPRAAAGRAAPRLAAVRAGFAVRAR